jgi:nucleoid DNA-binding protein
MKVLVDELMKEAGLSAEMAEKVIHMVVNYVEQDLPLSEKTNIDLKLDGVSQAELNKDRQPFIIP